MSFSVETVKNHHGVGGGMKDDESSNTSCRQWKQFDWYVGLIVTILYI